ncbi:MAG TPA: SH3 domain-containing protein [Alphaproteobacteria bacterium]|nr:SH3 domain-containing protein [Alphaproteobacteria bacterium]
MSNRAQRRPSIFYRGPARPAPRRGRRALVGLTVFALLFGLVIASVGHAAFFEELWQHQIEAIRAADAPLPVPRFVSLRADKVYVRAGPGVRYPIEWVFERKGMPVEVVAEFDNFRKVRDIEGTEGWVHMNLLSGRRDIIVTGAVRTLRREPRTDAPAVARAEPDVIGQLLECNPDWCRIDIEGFRGWLKRSEFWGLLPNEKIE